MLCVTGLTTGLEVYIFPGWSAHQAEYGGVCRVVRYNISSAAVFQTQVNIAYIF